MVTRVFTVDPLVPRGDLLRAAAEILRNGGLVAFPTETVYGLGADATSAAAVSRIFEAKGRPQDNPLIVHVHSYDAVPPLVAELPARAEVLMYRFWPGPLTLVLKKSRLVTENVSPGLATVGIRMPDHAVALNLIRLSGVPVAAPSANASGRPSPTSASHVLSDLGGKIEAVVDGGPCGIGVESTVLDLTVEPPAILRPGGTTREAVEEVLGDVVLDATVVNAGGPKSPGTKYRHYAPSARVFLVDPGRVPAGGLLRKFAAEFAARGHRVGVLASSEVLAEGGTSRKPTGEWDDQGTAWLDAGSERDLDEVAARLFDNLRRFDDLGADVVLAQVFPETGMGLAIMNRLLKAAEGRVLRSGS
ncbi:MAG: L-threonylcarbamoyladenylate synthase [Firmicutes bacterium]|nr:L-threonylcarbamoyladenylate synthase [Bacillota bacterium]